MAEVHEGGCVCKAIRYRVKGEPVWGVYVCHCTFCQCNGGSAFAVISRFKEENVEVVGDGMTTYEYTVDDTDRWRRVHFCNRCGTTIMATSEHRPGIRAVMVGTFDDPNWVNITRQMWTRSAQHWVVFPEDIESFEKGSPEAPTTG